MKRKASLANGSQTPAKLSKKLTDNTLDQKLASIKHDKTIEPVKSTSFRQRKAPSWLSSYVTNSSQEKEIKQAAEKTKLKMPRSPTLVLPSKREKDGAKEVKRDPVPTLLRKKSTLKLQISSPPISSSKDKQKPIRPTPSLSRRPTKILDPSNDCTSNSKTVNGKTKSSSSSKDLSTSLMKRGKLKVLKTTTMSSSALLSSSKPGKRSSISRFSSTKKIKEDTVTDSKVVEICDPSNSSDLSSLTKDDALSNHSDLTPPVKEDIFTKFNSQNIPVKTKTPFSLSHHKTVDQTIILPEQIQPNMLEIVICISTSGALREYLHELQEHIRELIWRLQSLVPNLRIGVMAHTQGGIHDDPARGSFSGGDHNYNRAGGHSGTKWLDLGATLSQICAFVDSLESEPTVYPDYVQDNLEMALWKLQRCMSWSSCSYRSVIMIGRGRPNRTTFYHQKEHWRSWIRSALELPLSIDIPVIDWELEAKIFAEMGIHVFTIQAVSENSIRNDKEDEGTCFFRRVAEITQSQHVRISDASKLPEIIIGICCACHGSELLLDHRDTVRDLNDGVLPTQLTEIFVGLQLHSKSNSLMALPSMLRNLDLNSMRQRLNGYGSRVEESIENSSQGMEYESDNGESSMELQTVREEKEMELTLSRAKTIRKVKTVKGNSKLLSGNTKMNGLSQKGNAVRSQSRGKPYEVGKKSQGLKMKAGRGVDKFIKVLDLKGKDIMRKRERTGSVRKTSGRIGNESLNGRQPNKRKVKLSQKVKENLVSVKNKGISKAKNKTSPLSELKKKAVKAVLKSETKEIGRKLPSSKITSVKMKTVTKSKKNLTDVKRKSVNGSAETRIAKKQRKGFLDKKKEKFDKVSPLNRNKSVGGKSPVVKTALSKKQQVVRNVRQKIKRDR